MQIRHKRDKKFPFHIEKAALLVIDMQNYFTHSSSHAYIDSSKEIIPKINTLISRFKKCDRPIIITRHIDRDQNNMMNRWWQDSIRKSNSQSEINESINQNGASLVTKEQYDAFLGTDLEKILKKKGVKQVLITGVVAHLCCESTARSAFMRNFETFFITDAVASKNPKHKEAAIFNLSHGFAIPLTTKDILKDYDEF